MVLRLCVFGFLALMIVCAIVVCVESLVWFVAYWENINKGKRQDDSAHLKQLPTDLEGGEVSKQKSRQEYVLREVDYLFPHKVLFEMQEL